MIGFIILRNINSYKTQIYYKICYKQIRKYYPENHIIIICDNSNPSYIDNNYDKNLYNTTIVVSDFPGNGEFLPFYYYYSIPKLFDTAIILQDSMFINQPLILNDKIDFLPIWHFPMYNDLTSYNQKIKIKKILGNIKENKIVIQKLSNKKKCIGCFGCSCIIKHDYLKKIYDLHDLSVFTKLIKNRDDRQCLERLIGVIFINNNTKSLLGNILTYVIPKYWSKINFDFIFFNYKMYLNLNKDINKTIINNREKAIEHSKKKKYNSIEFNKIYNTELPPNIINNKNIFIIKIWSGR